MAIARRGVGQLASTDPNRFSQGIEDRPNLQIQGKYHQCELNPLNSIQKALTTRIGFLNPIDPKNAEKPVN